MDEYFRNDDLQRHLFHEQVRQQRLLDQLLSRRYILNVPFINNQGSWDPSQFTKIRLLDQELSVDVDLSQIACGCNAALYMVSMPGYNNGGGHESDYYCDANQVGGVWCPEMDLMEANNHAMTVGSISTQNLRSQDHATQM